MSDDTSTHINISINRHLIDAGFQFIKITPREKIPTWDEKGWRKRGARDNTNKSLLVHLQCGGNYAVVGDSSHIIIDTDHEETIACLSKLPETFTVRSGSGRGLHAYFKCKNDGPIRLVNPQNHDDNWGDIQGNGKYAIGPGCVHPSGGVYEVVNDVPIADVEFSVIESVFSEFARKKRRINPEDVRRGYIGHESIFDSVSLADVGCWPVKASQMNSDGEIYGAHPIHGSSHGMNFFINPRKNVWKCFRCDSGGGPLEWLAVAEGIIPCEDAGAGALRGEKFLQVLEIAKDRGIKINLKKKTHTIRPRILDEDEDNSCGNGDCHDPDDDDEDDDGPDVIDVGCSSGNCEDWGIDPPEIPPPIPDPTSEPEPEQQNQSKLIVCETLPDALPDVPLILLDANPRIGKTHHVVSNWIACKSRTANVITTSHSIVEQQLRIFKQYCNSVSTAVHLEGKDRCCLVKSGEQRSCKACEYYPYEEDDNGKSFLDHKKLVAEWIREKKIVTKNNVPPRQCPYYILKVAEPLADYCFTVVANMLHVSERDVTFIDEDPAISYFFAESAPLMEVTFHQHHISAVSKIEERWSNIMKYRTYLNTNHRPKGKKTLLRIISILEQMRPILNLENISRSSRAQIIEELSHIDTTVEQPDDIEPYKLIEEVKRYETNECLSPYVEAFLFQYTNNKFMWTGVNPGTLHLVADADILIRPIPIKDGKGKIIIVGNTRARLFIRATGLDYRVLRINNFPYSDWFVLFSIQDQGKITSKTIMERMLKQITDVNTDTRLPMLVLTGSEKDQSRLHKILGGIAHCSKDEGRMGQMWNHMGGYVNIFYQNSVISRGIDVDFYNMLFVYSSDFANPYWMARKNHAREIGDTEDEDFVTKVLEQIVIDETTNSMLRISPVRSTSDRESDPIPRLVFLRDSDLWKVRDSVRSNMRIVEVTEQNYSSIETLVRAGTKRRVSISCSYTGEDTKTDTICKKSLLSNRQCCDPPINRGLKPDLEDFLKPVLNSDNFPRNLDLLKTHDKNDINEMENIIRRYLQSRKMTGRRNSESSLVKYIISHAPKFKKALYSEEIVVLVVSNMVRTGEIKREGGMGPTSMLSLRDCCISSSNSEETILDGGSEQFDLDI